MKSRTLQARLKARDLPEIEHRHFSVNNDCMLRTTAGSQYTDKGEGDICPAPVTVT